MNEFRKLTDLLESIELNETNFDIKEYRTLLEAIDASLQDAINDHGDLSFEHGHGGVSSRAVYHATTLEQSIALAHQQAKQLIEYISPEVKESQYDDDRGVHDELSRENDDGTIECPHCDGIGRDMTYGRTHEPVCKACNGAGRLEESYADDDDYDQYEGHGFSGSDYNEILDNMDKYIDKHGLSPESIMQAARNEAEAWSGPMGYRGDWTAAALAIKDAWVHMTKRGQQLQQMFAPKED